MDMGIDDLTHLAPLQWIYRVLYPDPLL
jgi:hypothetical protein